MQTLDSINMEITSKCNLVCDFCPLTIEIDREKFVELDFDRFRSIVDQCKEMGLSRIYLFLFGEPFLYSHFKDAVDYCGNIGIQDLWITTNGILLNKRNSKIVLKNISNLTVSMTGTSQKVYSKFQGYKRKLGLTKIEQNVRDFIKLRDGQNKYLPVTLSYILNDDSFPEWRAYYNKWVNVVDEIVFADYQEYHLEHFELNDDRIRPCREIVARNKLNFLSNGAVTVCCEDFNGKMAAGNMDTHSVSEIWNEQNEKIKEVKRSFQDLKYDALHPECKDCYMICRYYNFITSSQIKSSDRMLEYLNEFFPGKKVLVYGANSLTAAMLYTEEFAKRIVAVLDEHRMGKYCNKQVLSFDEIMKIDYDVILVNFTNEGKNSGLTKNQIFQKLKLRDLDKEKMVIYHSSAGSTDFQGSDKEEMLKWIGSAESRETDLLNQSSSASPSISVRS